MGGQVLALPVTLLFEQPSVRRVVGFVEAKLRTRETLASSPMACAAASFAAAVATVGRIHRFVELVRGAAWIDAGSLNRFEAGLVYGQRG